MKKPNGAEFPGPIGKILGAVAALLLAHPAAVALGV